MAKGAPARVIVVGAGPSGFYAADQLLTAGFEVDLLDALPTPYGLVRAGVAPDHPNIKAVTRVYEKTARRPGFRFFGGVELGRHVTRADLLARYHGVVYAIGTTDDNRLGIRGEDRPGSHSATRFVAWYNGHPAASDEIFDLSATRAVVVGNGNVAIDVARMLMLHPDELAPTDVADHAMRALARSNVKEVVLLGRRGPVQAAFTNPELRELAGLRRAGVEVDIEDLKLDEHSARWLASDAGSSVRKSVELLHRYAASGVSRASHRITLRFLRSPVEILGDGKDGRVTGVRVIRNRIEQGPDGELLAVATDQEDIIECGLVFRSIGYRGRPVDDVPFDARRGIIRNRRGRVCDPGGHSCPGEYAVGWIKRGPTGVIGTNKKDAAETVSRIIEDAQSGRLNAPVDPDPAASDKFFARRAPDCVTWRGWGNIDAAEQAAGEPQGRSRVKLVRIADLIEASRQLAADSVSL